jgi:hypothetical protein
MKGSIRIAPVFLQEDENPMANLETESPRRVLGGLTRDRAMLVSVGLLGCSALLIAMGHRGFFDGVANQVADFAGLTLGLCGGLYLILIWFADRFQMSIGRFMIVVAILAVLLQGFLVYRQWALDGLARPVVVAPPNPSGNP